MGKLGFYYDAAKCSGCRACQIACKDRADLPIGALYRTVRTYEVGSYPNATLYHYSHMCNHCENPACVANCPTGAMLVAADGTVQHDDEACIGCQTCVNSCPYGVPTYLEAKNVVGKCDACTSLREKGGNPACVDACLMRALDFGDVDELSKKYGRVGELVHEIVVLPSADLTSAPTLIHAKDVQLKDGYREIAL